MNRKIVHTPIGELVSKVSTWDPIRAPTNVVFRYVDISSVDQEAKVVREVQQIRSHEAPSRARQLVRQNDVLVSTVRPNLNAVAILPDDLAGATASTGFCVLRAKPDVLFPPYLFYWVRSPTFIRDMTSKATGASYPAVTDGTICDSRIPLPPLSEQKRIAAILDKADALRRKRQQALQLTEQFLRSTFLDMFGDPVSNPKKWPVVEASEVLEGMQYGTSERCSDSRIADAMPVLRIPNILHGVVNRNDLKYATLTQAETDSLLLRPGDILFVRTNGNPQYIGRCAVFEAGEPTLFASYLIRARVKPSVGCRVAYFRDCISFPTYRGVIVKEARTTAGNYNISTRGLRQLRLALPPLDVQDRYLAIVNRTENLLAVLRKELDIADNFFHSLVQRAFRGEL